MTSCYDCTVVIAVETNEKLIGIRIMQRRKSVGLTQDDLAERVGLSKNHISNIERGKNFPTTKFILQICDIMGETPDYYLIGKISKDVDELTSKIKRLPPDSQHMALHLIDAYLEEISRRK